MLMKIEDSLLEETYSPHKHGSTVGLIDDDDAKNGN